MRDSISRRPKWKSRYIGERSISMAVPEMSRRSTKQRRAAEARRIAAEPARTPEPFKVTPETLRAEMDRVKAIPLQPSVKIGGRADGFVGAMAPQKGDEASGFPGPLPSSASRGLSPFPRRAPADHDDTPKACPDCGKRVPGDRTCHRCGAGPWCWPHHHAHKEGCKA